MTVDASAAVGIRPSRRAVDAVALASAHPGQPVLAEREDAVGPSPERRPRLRAHEAGHDRFARIQRVPRHLLVEDHLQEHRDTRDPQQRRAIFQDDGRADQPFAAADRNPESYDPGAHRPQRVGEGKRRRRGELGHPPRGQRAMAERRHAGPNLSGHQYVRRRND